MSSTSDLYVDGCPILSFRNAVEPTIMALFTRNSLRRSIVRGSDRPELGYEPDEELETIDFVVTSEVLCDGSLAVLGIGQAAVANKFRELVTEKLAYWESVFPWLDVLKESREDEKALLEALDLAMWQAEVRRRIAAGEELKYPAVEKGSLGWLLGLWNQVDSRLLLRAVVDAMPGSKIVLDITDLVGGGWLQADVDPQQAALVHSGVPPSNGTPAIVLAEGRTDIEVLSTALRVLRPHLQGFLRFADFEMKAEGGAATLVKTVRAFAAAGVVNRVVALFDNDTAGFDAMRGLSQASLPANIVVSRYPEIERGRSYPTLGPSGRVDMDVNGLACGIEMYLGDDVLRDGDHTFRPVQWTGFVRALNRYQGELIEKGDLMDRFRAKAKTALHDPGTRASQDWSALSAILDLLVDVLGS